MRKIYLFGGGSFLKKRIDKIKTLPDTKVLGIVDNNPLLWGNELFGISILPPDSLLDSEYDLVVVTSRQGSIFSDLRRMGILKERIKTYEQYVGLCYRRKIEKYGRFSVENPNKTKSIVLMTVDLGYNGGTMAAAYALLALSEKGYRVVIASSGYEEKLVRQINESGIEVVIYPNLMFERFSNMTWLFQYDGIIVNTYQMHHRMTDVPSEIPILWWIHESPDLYTLDIQSYGRIKEKCPKNVKTFCVSRQAQQNLNQFYPDMSSEILEYGIPDIYAGEPKSLNPNKIVFGVIGSICEIKGQDVLLKALMLLDFGIRSRIEVMLIGTISENSYCKDIREMSDKLSMVYITGEVTHEKIIEYLRNIDVVICPSRQETLSIAVTEGLMMRKLCIISDATGMMDYVSPGEDVLAFSSGDSMELAQLIKQVVTDPTLIRDMAEKGRKVYENNFTMPSFANRLEKALFK